MVEWLTGQHCNTQSNLQAREKRILLWWRWYIKWSLQAMTAWIHLDIRLVANLPLRITIIVNEGMWGGEFGHGFKLQTGRFQMVTREPVGNTSWPVLLVNLNNPGSIIGQNETNNLERRQQGGDTFCKSPLFLPYLQVFPSRDNDWRIAGAFHLWALSWQSICILQNINASHENKQANSLALGYTENILLL